MEVRRVVGAESSGVLCSCTTGMRGQQWTVEGCYNIAELTSARAGVRGRVRVRVSVRVRGRGNEEAGG